MLGEPLGLRMYPSAWSWGTIIALGGIAPGWRSPRRRRRARAARSGWRSTASAAARRFRCGHQVRVDVVVGDRAVLVRSGDAVDPKAPGGVVVAERAPQPRRLDEQLEPDRRARTVVVGRRHVADDGVGDVGVDVEGGGAGRPVARALLAVDRAPRERGALEAERPARSRRQLERVTAPAQRIGGGARARVGQHRQHEGLGVPERVSVVAGSGQPLGGDRAPLGPGAGLKTWKSAEAHRLLELGVALDLDVGAIPEVVEVGALLGEQPVPAGVARLRERRADLVADRRRPSAGSTSRRRGT